MSQTTEIIFRNCIDSRYWDDAQRARMACHRLNSSFLDELAQEGAPTSTIPWYGESKVLLNFDWYAYLFADVFGNVEREKLRVIAIASELLAEYVVILDKLVDDQIENKEKRWLSLLANTFRYRRVLGLFHALFGDTPTFWRYLEQYSREWDRALLAEKMEHHGTPRPYSETEMEVIARGKAAVAKIVPTALAILSQSEEQIDPITESQDLYAVGFQLYDDLRDWKGDYERGQYSYLLSKAILDYDLWKETESNSKPDQETVGKTIYFSGLAEATMKKAENFFERATNRVCELEGSGWFKYISGTRAICKQFRLDLSKLRTRALEKAKVERGSKRSSTMLIPASLQGLRIALAKAVNFLLEQRKLGYPEAKHLELFSRKGKLPEESSSAWGDIFQRVVITDSLIEARENGLSIGEEIISEEIDKIVAAKLTRTRGGWSYFPSILSLPPDADDLGQVLQVLTKARYSRVQEVCQDAVMLLLEKNSHADGSVDTWIADPDDQASYKAKLDMQSVWGATPDTEVVANFLYGLHLFDGHRFRETIHRGVSYLQRKQTATGYWTSSWYWGRYYGIWVCTRIIKIITPNSTCLSKAIGYIKGSQRKDGGWGRLDRSNPLDTAFALMTIRYFLGKTDPELNSILKKGCKHLLSTQGKGGNWPATDFIRIRLAEPGGSTYKSSTVSTAYCVRALISCLRHLHACGS